MVGKSDTHLETKLLVRLTTNERDTTNTKKEEEQTSKQAPQT